MTAKIVVDDAELSAGLQKLIGKLNDPKPMFSKIGDILLTSTKERFLTQTSPTGAPWAPLHKLYLESELKKKSSFPTAILRLNGYLMGQMAYQAFDDHLELGSNRVYAAIHQFGGTIKPKAGKALAFGGGVFSQVVIPARPFLGISAADRVDILAGVTEYLAN